MSTMLRFIPTIGFFSICTRNALASICVPKTRGLPQGVALGNVDNFRTDIFGHKPALVDAQNREKIPYELKIDRMDFDVRVLL